MLFLAGLNSSEQIEKTQTISTKYGQLRGFYRPVAGYGLRVATYLGVPYATPPVGANRFSPTRTLSQWVGVHEALHFGPACPQRLPDIGNETAALTRMSRGRLQTLKRNLPALRRQSEDCLYLNLYVPDEGKNPTISPKEPYFQHHRHRHHHPWDGTGKLISLPRRLCDSEGLLNIPGADPAHKQTPHTCA